MKRDVLVSPRGGLDLPGKLTKTAWALPKDMPFEQWLACGVVLCEIEAALSWWIGDWWNAGEPYGDRVEAVREGLSLELSTVRQYGWVCSNVSIRIDTLSFTHHVHVAALPSKQQEKWLRKAEKEGWSANELKAAIARQAAIDRTQEIALDAAKLGQFPILYADPPWCYEHPPMGASNRSIENHYPTMTVEDICALPVGDLAYKDSALFMWATSPKLIESMDAITAWGFTYRTNAVWVKDKIGMGYYFREQHELLLIAKRGELPPPPSDERRSSVIEAPRLEHSAKPPVVRDILDELYPGVPKVELFAREQPKRKDWTYWGNHA